MFAAGGGVRGENAQDGTNQVEVMDPPPFQPWRVKSRCVKTVLPLGSGWYSPTEAPGSQCSDGLPPFPQFLSFFPFRGTYSTSTEYRRLFTMLGP